MYEDIVAVILIFILQASGEADNLGTMNFTVPAFHAYAHVPSCQVSHFLYYGNFLLQL